MQQVDPASLPYPGQPPAPPAPPDDPDSADFAFEQSIRLSASERSLPPGGLPRALREAGELSGLDPLSDLYNEALRYADEGHLRLARERLQMLLCMAPDDGDARLTLARVHVAGQRWSEALTALDEAVTCGVSVPLTLRRAVEDHLQTEEAAREEQRVAMRAREHGEVQSLRSEARRLRSDSVGLQARIGELEREVRKWAWTTAGVSGVAIVFVAASLALGGPSEVAPVAQVAEDTPAATVAPDKSDVVQESVLVPAAPLGKVEVAQAALATAPALHGLDLVLRESDDGTLILTGDLPTYRDRKALERVLRGVPDLAAIDVSGLVLLSRTQGATHEVQPGDTLSHIAYAYYGKSYQTQPIAEANGVDERSLRIGQLLVVPPVD